MRWWRPEQLQSRKDRGDALSHEKEETDHPTLNRTACGQLHSSQLYDGRKYGCNSLQCHESRHAHRMAQAETLQIKP